MDEKQCKVNLVVDDKLGWKIITEPNCDQVLEGINKNLGTYGKRYFATRILPSTEQGQATPTGETSIVNEEKGE